MNEPFADVEMLIEGWRDGVYRDALQAMEDTADDGAERVREIIHLSTTDWGYARTQGVGGEPRPYPGRIESGEMLNDVDSRVEELGDGVIEAKWGWADPEDYYWIQEYGFDAFETKIAPMHSLATSLDEAEIALQERLGEIS
jgi:hypothetical protein